MSPRLSAKLTPDVPSDCQLLSVWLPAVPMSQSPAVPNEKLVAGPAKEETLTPVPRDVTARIEIMNRARIGHNQYFQADLILHSYAYLVLPGLQQPTNFSMLSTIEYSKDLGDQSL